FDYNDWLATECGYLAVEEWRKQMYKESRKRKSAGPENYRDEWDDHNLIAQAQADFEQYLLKDVHCRID
ncbi:Flavin-containing monooxygenase FMO GS-OX5, partial [Asimina triloba]